MRVTPSLDTINSFTICNPPNPDFIQTDPTLYFNGENYVVAWSDEKNGSPNVFYTTVARVSPQGTVLDTGICVSNGSGVSEYRPNIAGDGERSLVVWDKSSNGIYGRFVSRAGLPEENVITIDYTGSGGANLAFDGRNYLVVWFSGAYPDLEIFGRLISPQGGFVGNIINVALGSGCHRWADVKFDGTNYLVVWETGDNTVGQVINGQFIATDGSLVGSNFAISSNTTNDRWWPALAVSDSNFLVTWAQGYISDIWGNTDVFVTGIEEKVSDNFPEVNLSTNIFSLEQKLFNDKNFALYDVLGRTVKPVQIKPGIYFIKNPEGIGRKIIRVK